MSKHLNLSGRIRLAASAPSNPIQGDEYYDTTVNALMRYDGSVWRGVVLGTTTTSTSTSTSTTSTSTSTTTS